MKYNVNTGVSQPPVGILTRFGLYATGACLGFAAASIVVVSQIQSSVQPVKPQVSAQGYNPLTVQPVAITSYNQMAEPADFQPALGYLFVQYGLSTQVMQPATHSQNYQNPATTTTYQHPVTDYQLQGERLTLN